MPAMTVPKGAPGRGPRAADPAAPTSIEPAGPARVDRILAELQRVVVVAEPEAAGQLAGEPVGLMQRVRGARLRLLHDEEARERRGGAVGAALGRGRGLIRAAR